jgi:hypothetical protein
VERDIKKAEARAAEEREKKMDALKQQREQQMANLQAAKEAV